MKLGYIIITDRYVYDLLLDIHCTTLCKVAVRHLFPKPCIVFYLNNEAEIIWERKKELPLNEMVRQIKIFNDLQKYYPIIAIKSDEIGETIDRVAEEYFYKLAT